MNLFSRLGLSLVLFILAFGAPGVSLAGGSASPTPDDLSASEWAQVLAQLPDAVAPNSQQAYLKASNTGRDDHFGYSVAVSGDTLVVGAYWEQSSATGVNGDQGDNLADRSGAAYVFTRSGETWSQQAYLKASNTGADDFFGSSVAISGDTIVVGAYYEDSNATGVNGDQDNNDADDSGAVYVFTRSGETWSQQAYLKASNTGADDWFGHSVAVSGDMVVVGAFMEDSTATGIDGDDSDNSASNSGAAYVFTRSGTTWSQGAYLKASNTELGDVFGDSVAIDSDTVVVGASSATGSTENSGAAYVFISSAGVWSQQALLKATNTEGGDEFGTSTAIDGDTIAVGALGYGNTVGAAYVFTRSGGAWNQEAALTSSNAGDGKRFGLFVGVSGDTVVAGSDDCSLASGVNGEQNNNDGSGSGAAFVFVRSGGEWRQQSYLKASHTGAGDAFGHSTIICGYCGSSIAISGDTLAVGAMLEDSQATGVNGNQWNNKSSNSGAVYVFVYTPKLYVTSQASNDGWIRESGETSNQGGDLNSSHLAIPLGDFDLDQQYRAVLHFDTSGLPDNAKVTKATLKIKRISFIGDNPFLTHGNIVLDIRRGAFYANPTLQLIDFRAVPNLAFAGTILNDPVIGFWYSGELKSAALPFINRTGTTQFRLRFYKDDNDDQEQDVIRLYTGDHSDSRYRPVLEIEYSDP